MILFDPVLGSRRKNFNKKSEPKPFKNWALCYHCYKHIEGKVYYYDDKPFDEFCFQFRYVLFPPDKEKDEKKEQLGKALARERAEED
jgi:hypothetical protein